MIIATHGILASAGGIVYDADAQAFFDRVTAAGGTLSATEKTAVNQLVLDMKSYSIWTAMKAIYPMVGASAAACAQNLKSSSFTGTFNGGWTFASTGATPNGTTGYMDTGLTPSTELNVNSNGIGFYTSRANSENKSDVVNMGSFAGATQSAIILYNQSNNYNARLNGNSGIATENGLKGFFHAYRQSNTVTSTFNNSTKKNTFNSGGTLPNWKVFIGNTSLNSNSPYADGYTTNDFRFAFIGNGLTDTEANNFYTAVQAFQTTLSRQV